MFEKPDLLAKVPEAGRLLVLALAACFVFYLVSAVMNSAYMFLVLRKRMQEIESEVNERLKKTALAYETRIAPRFLEQLLYADSYITPQALSGVWRILLLAGSLAILAFLAHMALTSRIGALIYSATILYVGLLIAFKFARLTRKAHKQAFEKAYAGFRSRSLRDSWFGIGQWLFYYVAIIASLVACFS